MQSVKGIQWLHYMSVKLNCQIEPEVKIGGYYVDGYGRDLNIVFEFQWCATHGSYACYGSQTKSPKTGKSIATLHQETLAKINSIQNASQEPKIIHMWEHDFDLEYAKKDSEMRAIIQDANSSILVPPTGFFRG